METQTNFQKGNLYFIIAIIVGVFAIGAVGFASWKYFGESSELEKETQPVYSLEKEKTVPEVKKQEEIIPSGKVDKISSIKILSPNGGEKLIVGKTYNITWDCPDNAEIDVMDIYIQDKRLSDKGIITPIGGSIINCSAEKYSWQIKDISPGENCFKVQLRHVAGSVPLIDESDNYFSIKTSGIQTGKFEIDYEKINKIQQSVNEGHQPWRLDSKFVVTTEGLTYGFVNDDFKTIKQISFYASAGTAEYEVMHNNKSYTVVAIKPIPGENKIWIISEIKGK